MGKIHDGGRSRISTILNGRLLTGGPPVSAYRVGEPFQPGQAAWPAGAQYSYGVHGHELVLFRPEVADPEIEAVSRGESEFALIVKPSVFSLAYRFGRTIPWSDVPYCWHLRPVDRRLIPPPEVSPEARALLWISLVGADDGVIHAQRGVALSPNFTRTLQDAIRAQARTPFDPHRCTSSIGRIYLQGKTTVDRLPLAVARTLGNA